ncbi:ras association domain-containing protein 1 isoform X1 [Electrophorus electricus]|uniref:Ras association domain family member 1 n=1 Tax=Electrophorus electricus TaxID=8005 RepID=A0A4W4E165_ELEEL|nr:ras association domain-containing protein 1 isoform X1 [Electrophorus electricus]XP_026876164.2 ras association domain-containing protein 1 isoform X1 [Electrophorus electricus]XP_035376385.1 ras association domain-containing protein 1 isoform X1 [Electrophorus electricus]XP_035376386.1 ras association domain-containing protein 1 isoform X1 [Electrophorus electricus]XP_035376387.1 ras association domain-containing protein 1 isoform X1 [Electrophorus electricus]XP_035376388.1 ras association
MIEFIELKDLTPNDRIELAPPAVPTKARQLPMDKVPERPRRGVVVRLDEADWVAGRHGAGHVFQPSSHAHLTWCDLCGEFIWGLYKQNLRCVNCRYTCHSRCQPFIKLDCISLNTLPGLSDYSENTETDTNVDDPIDWQKLDVPLSEIQRKIKQYNAQVNSNLYMTLNQDGSYTGFIKVQFKLARPVSVPLLRRPTSSSPQQGGWRAAVNHRTSFYLPRDTAEHLHVSSRTRAREVIEALLNKFRVVDRPAKFALFEHSMRRDQVYLRKLSDDECPLLLRLCAGPSEKALGFVLKENELGEVNWDAFSLPELRNFLRILQREEEEHMQQITRRYSAARHRLAEALQNFSTPG